MSYTFQTGDVTIPPLSLAARVCVFLGDLTILLVFVVVGIHSHGGNAFQMPAYTLDTLTPFLLTWLIIAPLLGLYARRTLTSYRWSIALVPIAWILVSLFGAQIRATDYFYGGAPLEFIAVNIVFGILFLVPWRIFVVWLSRIRTE